MEQTSCNLMWNLLAPSPEFKNCWSAFRDYWHRQTLARQRQLYWYFREAKRRGDHIKENPLFAIQDCHPQPTNWNGKEGINSKIKTTKMVIAKYNGFYGTYTSFEAKLFEMTDVKEMN